MACSIEEVPFDPTDFDKQLGDLLIKVDGDVSSFLVTIFGFLKRKSNFFKTDDPAKRVMDAYKEVAGDAGIKSGFLSSSSSSSKSTGAAPSSSAAAKPAPAAAQQAPPPPPPPQPAAASPAVAPAPPVAASAASAAPAPAAGEQASGSKEPEAAAAPKVEELPDEDDSSKPKGIKPNSGRGCDYGHYSWTQTLHEVTVTVPVPAGIKAKELDVVMTRTRLKVGLKGKAPIVDGELSEAVKVEDCLWNKEGNTVEVTLQKADGMHWWSSVLKGDPSIDTQKVEPENSKLTDLDAETRQTVEKMMFDQRQKALGLPTSEEMQRQEMLKKFMAAHPEMDFSNAKMM